MHQERAEKTTNEQQKVSQEQELVNLAYPTSEGALGRTIPNFSRQPEIYQPLIAGRTAAEDEIMAEPPPPPKISRYWHGYGNG